MAVFSAYGQFFPKIRPHGLAMLVAAWCIIEFSLITAQARRLNNPKVPMHQLMMANHEEVLAAVERYLPRAFWSKSWWHASPSCKKGSCANYGQSPAEVKNWFKTVNWTVALLKKSGCPVLDIRKHSQAASMFLGFSHGACVPNGAALRATTEAGHACTFRTSQILLTDATCGYVS